jgi:hypothetical protein
MMEYQKKLEIEWVTEAGCPIYLIDLSVPDEMEFWNYEQPELLISRGRELAQSRLDSEPLIILPEWRLWIGRVAAKLRRSDVQDEP